MAGKPDRDGRAERLSAALRANLRRRKQPAQDACAEETPAALQRRADPLSPAVAPATDEKKIGGE